MLHAGVVVHVGVAARCAGWVPVARGAARGRTGTAFETCRGRRNSLRRDEDSGAVDAVRRTALFARCRGDHIGPESRPDRRPPGRGREPGGTRRGPDLSLQSLGAGPTYAQPAAPRRYDRTGGPLRSA